MCNIEPALFPLPVRLVSMRTSRLVSSRSTNQNYGYFLVNKQNQRRLVMRAAKNNKNINIVAVNDPFVPTDYMNYSEWVFVVRVLWAQQDYSCCFHDCGYTLYM